jgi:hypothetical protein
MNSFKVAVTLLLTDGYSYLTQNTAHVTVHTNPTRERGELRFILACASGL